MVILRGFPPSNTISPGPRLCVEDSSPDSIVYERDYGYIAWHHCSCSICESRRSRAKMEKCTDCDGCRRLKSGTKLPWSVRLAQGNNRAIK